MTLPKEHLVETMTGGVAASGYDGLADLVFSNRDGVGAQVRIGSQMDLITPSNGYASSSRQGVHFRLGEGEAPTAVKI